MHYNLSEEQPTTFFLSSVFAKCAPKYSKYEKLEKSYGIINIIEEL